MAKNRRNADFIISTVRLHVAHVADQNKRIVHAAQQQRAVHNRTVEHLLRHQSDEPLHKSTAKGITGLFGRWPNWRTENEALADTPSLVARAGISAASDQVTKWETTNRDHAVLVAKAQIDAKPIPKRVQRRTPNPRRLYRARKREERLGRHRVRIDENVRRVGRRTIHVPGVGKIQTKDDIPENLDIRSCIILGRTPRTRLKPGLDPTERTFRIHATGRLPKPAAKTDDVGKACGIDHGVVTAMTVGRHQGQRPRLPARPRPRPQGQPAPGSSPPKNQPVPAGQPDLETAAKPQPPTATQTRPPPAAPAPRLGEPARPRLRHDPETQESRPNGQISRGSTNTTVRRERWDVA